MASGGHIFWRRLPRARSFSAGRGVKPKNMAAWRHFPALLQVKLVVNEWFVGVVSLPKSYE